MTLRGSSTNRAVVQSAGKGFRPNAGALQEEFERMGPVLHLLLRFTQANFPNVQTAVCNRHHSLDQQLCRWLLLSLDRLQGDDLEMTQELISNMLGGATRGCDHGGYECRRRLNSDPPGVRIKACTVFMP